LRDDDNQPIDEDDNPIGDLDVGEVLTAAQVLARASSRA
jgi:hypothetical protein